ncbi:PAS domain-containing sensor histidine kinase [Desulfobacula phenolica]|uniref:histidine kinase n=1 Tax=Desulfobacula phenolica TaxID=90732 RepID=A0A1H2JSJ7_9BACT|nr:PAS domain-containing sensor histidine kinase [Desulfobacula phenolica]SDU59390.1 PAS domain S-box-containing protein [Desulfobacula phenolica]
MLFSSIRTKLICILMILGAIPLLVVGAVSYHSAANALLVQTRQQLDKVAQKTAQQVDHFFDAAQKDIDLLSKFPFIQLTFLQFEFNQRLDTSQRLLADYFQSNPNYNGIYLVNLAGKTILSVTGDQDDSLPDFSGADWFAKTLETGRFLSDLQFSNHRSSKVVMLGKIVYDFENPDKIVGVLAFDLKKYAFVDYVASLRIGEKGYAFLIHKNGFLIYHPDKEIDSETDIQALSDHRFQTHINNMMDGKKGFGNYTHDHAEKFIVYLPCTLMNWSIGVTVFKSELMADIHTFRNQIISFIMIIIGLFLPVSFLFIKSLTRPILQLIKGAEAIGKGDLDQRIEIKSNDELSAVAREFNKMVATLKKNMKEIVDLKTFMEDIFRNVSSGIITVDEAGQISSINQSAQTMLGYGHRETSGTDGFRPCEPVQQVVDLLKHSMKSGENTRDHELKLARSDDKASCVEINTSQLTDQSGGLIGAIADIRDITRRKRMEELMVRVDKLASLGQLSAGMAHEIRNPLAGMKTSLQVLAERARTDAEQILISGVLSEINRLNTIVSDLLRFSRPSPPLPAPVNVKNILEKTIGMVKEKLKKSDIRLICRYDKDLSFAMADQEQMHQVFLNLILNSLTAMEAGGELTITAGNVRNEEQIKTKLTQKDPDFAMYRAGFVEIRFKDTGHGISKEALPRVFDPFFSTSPKGTGLGLSIVHKLLEKNKGYIFIDSVVQQGTQVRLLLPASDKKQTGDR